MKWEPTEPPTFKNGGPWNIMAAIVFKLQATVMLYLNFQRDIVPHNFHVCAAIFKNVQECRNAVL